MSERIPINPAVLKWARERSGYSIEEISKSNDLKKYELWETNQENPTYGKLETLAKKFQCPIAVFFFPEPPKIEPINKSFRTLPDVEFDRIPPEIKKILLKAKAMQMNLYELNENVNPAKKNIVNDIKVNMDDPIEEVIFKVRTYLNVDLSEQKSWQNEKTALDNWREVLFNCGVNVFKDSFGIYEFDGFCLYDNLFPIIYLNNTRIYKSRQIFTIFHELGHLLHRTSGIYREKNDIYKTQNKEQKKVEVFCNQFAANFLVPNNDFDQILKQKKIDVNDVEEIASLYNVSKEVILRKLLERNIVNQKEYKEKTTEWNKKNHTNGQGGNYYYNQITYLGKQYLQLALDRFDRNLITTEQLSEYLNVGVNNIEKLEDTFLGLNS